MRDQIEQRLRGLQQEFETGQRMLAELENKQASLRQTLQRISGAIQVLEEVLAAEESSVATVGRNDGAIAAGAENPHT